MHRVAAQPVQEIPRFAFNAPWAEGFDTDVFMRTVGLVILVALAVLYAISAIKEHFYPELTPRLQGARLILNDVLPEATRTPVVRERFEGADWEIMPFVMEKAVYLYAYGRYREAPLPDFFKSGTRESIRGMRAAGIRNEIQGRLETLFATFETYERETANIALGAAAYNVVEQIGRADIDAVLENQAAIDAHKDVPENIEDPSIRQFQLNKLIYLFAFGRDRENPVPELFTENIRDHIQRLRTVRIANEGLEKLEQVFATQESYTANLPELELNATAHTIIQNITPVANNEYHNDRNSRFMTECWPEAVALLPQVPPVNTARQLRV
ncbi:MAG: hypothetical protein ACHQT8_02665 [Chlamydiales bacterium]